MAPSRSPFHFANELELAASPETIWSLLVDPKAWPGLYPGVEHVKLLDGHESLRLGTRFETNLAGQDVFASVQEFEPMTRICAYRKLRLILSKVLPASLIAENLFLRKQLAFCQEHKRKPQPLTDAARWTLVG